MKALKGDGKTVVDIPADLKDAAEEAHMKLVEAAAEGDDSLLEKYLESGELSAEEILSGLKEVVRSCNFVPVFVSSGAAEIGIQPLLDAIVTLMPSPAETAPVQAVNARGETEELRAGRFRPAGSVCVENHRRSFCRQANFLPRIFRHAQLRFSRLEPDQGY